MNYKILIVFAVVLVVFLAAPVAIKTYRDLQPAAPVVMPETKEAPYWNAGNFAGTAWEIKHPEIPVPVIIYVYDGGVAQARIPAAFAPMARQMIGTDTLTGTWSIAGATLTASVTFQGKTQSVNCEINGQRIFAKDDKGKNFEAKRVQ